MPETRFDINLWLSFADRMILEELIAISFWYINSQNEIDIPVKIIEKRF